MKLQRLIFLICLLLVLNACDRHIYTPALYHQDIAYQPKPASFDTAKTANYFSGGVNYYVDQTWTDLLVSGQLNYSRGHVFHNFNLAYGVFGVAGDYEKGSEGTAPDSFKDKFFGAVGARMSANLFTSFERMDFRYLGVEMAYSHEFGSFANFRRYINTQPGYEADTRTDLVTLGLTTEIIFHNRNNVNIEHGIRGFLGGTFGPNPVGNNTDYVSSDLTPQFFRNIFPKVSYFINVKNFFGVAEIGSAIFVRAGVKF
jgi:hypothetical protein